jgi:hypothetical protein
MARFNPPDRRGTIIAKVRSPRTGSWKAIDPKFEPVKKSGVDDEKPIMTTARPPRRNKFSVPIAV